MFLNGCADFVGDFFWVEMQLGGQAGQVQMRPAVRLFQVENFPRQRPAGDQQNTARLRGERQAFFCQITVR
jgi:hypothetical protein